MNAMLKSVVDPTALRHQTTELQVNFRTVYENVEDPTALRDQTTELQANFPTLC